MKAITRLIACTFMAWVMGRMVLYFMRHTWGMYWVAVQQVWSEKKEKPRTFPPEAP